MCRSLLACVVVSCCLWSGSSLLRVASAQCPPRASFPQLSSIESRSASMTATTSAQRKQRGDVFTRSDRSRSPFEASAPRERKRLRFHHAKGRAYLSTMGPVLVGSTILRLGESTEKTGGIGSNPVSLTGLSLLVSGILIGPSMGLWCTKGRQSSQAWWGVGVRTVGVGAVAFGLWRALENTEDDGLGAAVAAPLIASLFALPGIIVTTLGVRWSLDVTPDRWCKGHGDAFTLEVRPHVTLPTGGPGVRLQARL